MRRFVVGGVLVLAMVTVGASAALADGRFSDDDGNVHETAIETIAAAGVTLGCNPPANDLYCPTDRVTRAQMATFLDRLLRLPATTVDAFDDDTGSVHEGAINRLAAAGVTAGCNPPANNLYCPEDPVTRGQMATFLTRALDLGPGPSDRFTDDDDSVHEGDIDRLAASGVTLGCNPPANTAFCPSNPVLRDQMASFLARALPLVPGEVVEIPNDVPIGFDDTYGVDEDDTLVVAAPGVLGNDVDTDGDILTAVVVSPPLNGVLALAANGSFTYAPNPGFFGVDVFTYAADDGIDRSQPTTVQIVVAALDRSIVSVDDSFRTGFATTLRVASSSAGLPGVFVSGSVLSNDAGGIGSVATTVVEGPDHGLLDLEPNGTFTYTPEFGFAGTDTFTYAADDGTTGGQATVAIVVESTRVVYIDGNATPPADPAYLGTMAHPHVDFLGAVDASLAGDILFVFAAGPYDTAVAPKPGQQLVGEAAGLVIDGMTAAAPGSRPEIASALTMAADTSATGLQALVANASGTFGDVVFTDMEFIGANVPVIDASGTGTITIDAATTIISDSIDPAVNLAGAVGADIAATIDGGIAVSGTTGEVTFSGPIDASGTSPSECVSIAGTNAPVNLTGGGTLDSCSTGLLIGNPQAAVTVSGDWDIVGSGTALRIDNVGVGVAVTVGSQTTLSDFVNGLTMFGVDGDVEVAASFNSTIGASRAVQIGSSDGTIDLTGPMSVSRADYGFELNQSNGTITLSGGGSITDAGSFGLFTAGPSTGTVEVTGSWAFDGNEVAVSHRTEGGGLLTLGPDVAITESTTHAIEAVFDADIVVQGDIDHPDTTTAAISAQAHTGDLTVNGAITGSAAVDVGGSGQHLFTGPITLETTPGSTGIELGSGDHTFTAPVVISGTGFGVNAFGSGTVSFASLDIQAAGGLGLSDVASFDVADPTGALISSDGPALTLDDAGLPSGVPFSTVSSTGGTVTVQNTPVPLTLTGVTVAGLDATIDRGFYFVGADVTLIDATVTGTAGRALLAVDSNLTVDGGSFAVPFEVTVNTPGISTVVDGATVSSPSSTQAFLFLASATADVVITGTTFTGGDPSVELRNSGIGDVEAVLSGNNIVSSGAARALVLDNFTGGTASWTLTNNRLQPAPPGAVFALAVSDLGGATCVAATGTDVVSGQIRFSATDPGSVSISQPDEATFVADNGLAFNSDAVIGTGCVP